MGALPRGYAPSDLLGERLWLDWLWKVRIEPGRRRDDGESRSTVMALPPLFNVKAPLLESSRPTSTER